MKTFAVSVVLAGIAWSASAAEVYADTFPYEAIVNSEKLEVRSGPGQAYYATSFLQQGEKVVVHRHDPGGWYQISPPNGSYSWVRADQVELRGNTGIVLKNDTIVRVGSDVEDKFDVEQRRLLEGDEVQVIGEKNVTSKGRTARLLKIVPPSLEYRWVKGDYLAPANRSNQIVKDQDPYAFPSGYQPVSGTKTEMVDFNTPTRVEPIAANHDSLPSMPGDPRSEKVSSSFNNSKTKIAKATAKEEIEAGVSADEMKRLPASEVQQTKLETLDDQFRVMIKSDMSTWNLNALEVEYKQLQAESTSSQFQHQIDLRLSAVERYAKTKRDHDEFHQIVNTTSMVDQQLVQTGSATDATVIGPDGNPIPAAGNMTPAMNVMSSDGTVIHGPASSIAPEMAEIPANGMEANGIQMTEMPSSGAPVTGMTPANMPANGMVPGVSYEVMPDGSMKPLSPDQANQMTQNPYPNGQMPAGQMPNGMIPAPNVSGQNMRPGQNMMPPGYQPMPTAGKVPGYPNPSLQQASPIPGTYPANQPYGVQPMSGTMPQNNMQSPAGMNMNAPRQFALSGAGVIQRSPKPMAGGPTHVLMAPGTNRVLAYLQPQPGVNLDGYLGRAMGVMGTRQFNAQLSSDVITVEQVSQVKLAP